MGISFIKLCPKKEPRTAVFTKCSQRRAIPSSHDDATGREKCDRRTCFGTEHRVSYGPANLIEVADGQRFVN